MTRKELLPVITAVKHFHHYLYGRKFTIRTDHGSLRWLTNFKQLEGQFCRWVNVLENYDYEIVHRPGRAHGNADALSRLPCYDKTCTYCDKVEDRNTLQSCRVPVNKEMKQTSSHSMETSSECHGQLSHTSTNSEGANGLQCSSKILLLTVLLVGIQQLPFIALLVMCLLLNWTNSTQNRSNCEFRKGVQNNCVCFCQANDRAVISQVRFQEKKL